MLLVAGVLRDIKVNSTVSFSEHAQNLMLFANSARTRHICCVRSICVYIYPVRLLVGYKDGLGVFGPHFNWTQE
jgi:hypothetical protein